MQTPTSRPLRIVALLVSCGALLISSRAPAFQPVVRPWPSTPPRGLEMSAAPRSLADRSLREVSMRAISARPDGTPAVLWATRSRPQATVPPKSQLELQALAIGRRLADELGLDPDDVYVAGSMELDASWTSVALGQRWHGLVVDRSGLMLTFQSGQLSTIQNTLALPPLPAIEAQVLPRQAELSAAAAARSFAPDSKLTQAARLEVWVGGDHPGDARLAYRVHSSSWSPRSELDFHIDARTGEILAADDAIRYANGEGRVHISAHVTNLESPLSPFTLKSLGLGANGATDGDGDAIAQGPVQATYSGPYAIVQDQSGAQIETFSLAFGGAFQVLDLAPKNATQADPFTYLNTAKAFDIQVMPRNDFIKQRMPVNVNLNETCNAYFDGESVNFFRAGDGCANTGQIKTIVMHELGHGVQASLTPGGGDFDGAIGEGTADFHAAHIAEDPKVGIGFIPGSTEGARPVDQPKVYPTDLVGEIHEDGRIWATAMWDFRGAMIQKHGAGPGRRITFAAFLRALTQNPTLARAYPALIAADDDDADPTNGTPNSCEINKVFAAHGLVNGGNLRNTLAPTRAFVRILHEAPGSFTLTNGKLRIVASTENRSDPSCGAYEPRDLELFVAPGLEGGSFAEVPLEVTGSDASADLSQFKAGDSFRYYFQITAGAATFNSGTSEQPHIGVATDGGRRELVREGFENGLGAWKHGTVNGDLRDDWEVDAPRGLAADPDEAHGGAKVVGTDLGGGGGNSGTDGIAKAGRRSFLEAPPVETLGKRDLRLELWHRYAITGKLRVLVDGREIWSQTGSAANPDNGGWRFLSVPLGDAANDKTAVTVRFEVEAETTNTLGGWTLDDVAITGVDIAPPMPPSKPHVDDPSGGPIPRPDDMNTSSDDDMGDHPRRGGDRLGGVQGGCTCAQPRSTSERSALLLIPLALAFVLRDRRARRRS